MPGSQRMRLKPLRYWNLPLAHSIFYKGLMWSFLENMDAALEPRLCEDLWRRLDLSLLSGCAQIQAPLIQNVRGELLR